ncbi:MAG: hypothetical protein HXY30_09660, partial [Pseudorhodoplanes sp.]|nr:hypothetical protein [Pseudorhodoplanes sp.]
MANPPKKAIDPTEEAMSAIQEALSVRDSAVAPSAGSRGPRRARLGARPAPANDLDTAGFERPRAPRLDEELYGPRGRLEDDIPHPPANDDRQRVGDMLQNLQTRGSRRTYLWAAFFALFWMAAVAVIAPAFLPDARGAQDVAAALLILSAVVVLPVVLFFVIALLLSRARELRLIAQSMTEVAMRLGEPENFANEAIVTVGQAIRREVAAMGDGVERA